MPADSDHEFEASVLSDSLLDRKPRKRAINLALGLDELYRGGTKRLKVRPACMRPPGTFTAMWCVQLRTADRLAVQVLHTDV
jgi:hypothetical protein